MSIQDIDRMVDEILSKAEKERERIIQEARRKAAEILSRPVPVDQYRAEAEEIIRKARVEADRLIREAEARAVEMKKRAYDRIDEAVDYLVKLVAGLEK